MRTKIFFVVFCLFVGLSSVSSSPSYGEELLGTASPEKEGSIIIPQITEAEINVKIDDIQSKIKVFQDAENEKTAASLGVSLAQLKERTEKAQETLVFYNRQILALKRAETFASDKKFLEEAVSTGKAFELPQIPPLFA